MQTKAKSYPVLRGLMAKYGLNHSDLSKIVGNIHKVTIGSKINLKSEFTINEMRKIQNYFSSLGEDCSIQEIFFDWMG